MLEESERGAVTIGVGNNVPYGGKTASRFASLLTVGGADLLLDDRPILRNGRVA
jgi:hypothetical protein